MNFDSGNIPPEGSNIPPLPGDHSAKGKKKRSGALYAASLWRSPTAHADPHSRHSSGYANTGTNISYEGPTAPGSGGCVGTGFASGKDALGENMRNESDYTHMRTKSKKAEEDESKKDDDYTPNNDV